MPHSFVDVYGDVPPQVEELLAQDSENEEFRELNASLEEVVELTRDLLLEALQGASISSGLSPDLQSGEGSDYAMPTW